jgi:hypothetical protein
MTKISNEKIREVLEFYKSKDIAIHLNLSSQSWLNGKIGTIFEDRFILIENKLGEMLIRFDRIEGDEGIEPMRKQEKEVEDENEHLDQ